MPKGNPSPAARQQIEEIGLKRYLDDTAGYHKQIDYAQFVEIVNREPNKSEIARLMGVERRTISRWLEIYDKEQESAA